MKYQDRLAKLAAKFQAKYALTTPREHIQESILNASSDVARQKEHGIMDFMEQLKTDKANMSITVSKGMFGNVSVSEPSLTPSEVAPHYAGLSNQIKKYLEKNIELFNKDDENTNLVLQYLGAKPSDGVAIN